LTVTDKETIRKILNTNHKNTHTNAIRIKENKQLNIEQKQQKQKYPVAFYDSQPANEVGKGKMEGRVISRIPVLPTYVLYNLMI